MFPAEIAENINVLSKLGLLWLYGRALDECSWISLVDEGKGGELEFREKRVVTCFLSHGGRVLLLKRGSMVGSYRGKWAAVSGYVEEEPDEQAYREIWEETGLRGGDVELRSKADPIAVVDQEMETKWVVHPYLFEVKDPGRIRLNWEHVEARWVKPEEVKGFDTVPMLYETLEKVLKQGSESDFK